MKCNVLCFQKKKKNKKTEDCVGKAKRVNVLTSPELLRIRDFKKRETPNIASQKKIKFVSKLILASLILELPHGTFLIFSTFELLTRCHHD